MREWMKWEMERWHVEMMSEQKEFRNNTNVRKHSIFLDSFVVEKSYTKHIILHGISKN